jgi:NADH-quinone oxidoreductase subunit A
MQESYLPILILIGISVLNAVGMVSASHLIGARRPSATKLTPYESGMTPLGSTRERFSVKFYMVALLFIVFELETVFLMPWATVFRSLGLFGFVGMLLFVGILLVAFVYAWKKGALQWD